MAARQGSAGQEVEVVSRSAPFLDRLEDHLSQYSYLGGHEPTCVDDAVANRLQQHGLVPNAVMLPAVCRWYAHINSFDQQERSNFSTATSPMSAACQLVRYCLHAFTLSRPFFFATLNGLNPFELSKHAFFSTIVLCFL